MYIYNYLDELYEKDLYDKVSATWRKTNPAISNLKVSKEEKKMHKKRRIMGHVAHVLYDKRGHSSEYLYTVDPEKHEVVAWLPIYTYGDPDALPEYNRYEWVRIIPNMLGRHGYLQEAIHELQTAVFGSDYRARDILAKIATSVYDDKKNLEEEKKMTEYYVIDVEMTYADYKTKATECLQIRQTGNYFEIPFDGPDCSEYRLDRLVKCLCDYVNETKDMFKITLEKSEICSNSVLKITSPYVHIADYRNREEICKMLAYAAEHGEYPYPVGNAGLSKICFYLRECKNRKIYESVYSEGIDCTITIEGKVFRDGFYFDYIPEPRDIIKLRFMDGRLTHYTLADDPNRELIAGPGNTPGALYHIYKRDKPYRYVKELRESLHEIYSKRAMWQNASYVTFTPHNLTD